MGILAWIERPRLLVGPSQPIDTALLLLIAAVGLQILPLGAAFVGTVDPSAVHLLRQLMLGADAVAPTRLSIDPAATAAALLDLAGACAMFWIFRQLLARHGIRLLARTVAALGLIVSAVAVAQRFHPMHRIYGLVAPRQPGAVPFGPFVNPDHFATWVIMAIPLTIGYLVARQRAMAGRSPRYLAWTARLSRALGDPTRVWLIAAVAGMSIALVATTSRAGLVGLAAAGCAAVWLSRHRLQADDRRWLWPTLAIILLLVLSYAELGRWLVRFGAVWSDSGERRLDIWRDALRVSRDFWLTGTGAGSFGRAMLVYQSGDRTLFFNQAHSQYLQVLAEGGLLLAVPALAAGVCLFAGIRRALARDRTATYWLRVGATAGLFGVAVQSLWETGLRMPANAVLCAALAAIALHGRE